MAAGILLRTGFMQRKPNIFCTEERPISCISDCAFFTKLLVVVSITATDSSFAYAQDDSVIAWGANFAGQIDVPAPNTSFIAIAACDGHSLGLKSDGTIVAWGTNLDGQLNIPTPNSDFVAISGGTVHSLGLKSDGTIVA